MNGIFHGYLIFTMLTGALVAMPVTWLLLRRYKNRMIELMRRNDTTADSAPEPQQLRDASAGIQPQIKIIEDRSNAIGKRHWGERQKNVINIYIFGVSVYAVVITALQFMAESIEFLPGRFGVVALVYFWPFFLLWPFISGVFRKKYIMGIGIYLFVYFFASALLMRKFDLYGLIVLLLISNLLPTSMALLLLIPRLRAAGIIVLVLTSFCIAGAYGLPNILYTEEMQRMAVTGFTELGVERAEQMFFWLNVLGGLIGIAVSWLLLRVLRSMYQKKLLSDKSIITDGIMLYFSFWVGLLLAFNGILWFFLGMGAFLAYKLPVYYLLQNRVFQTATERPPLKLLILRVFALGERSDRLFRRIGRYWRLFGPVQIISGPDLVHSTIEPHEFMDFLTGRLSHQFLSSEEQIKRKVAGMDTYPAADGNYMVNDFYAYNNTWKKVLSALVDNTDQVMMDLRSFSPARQGCIHEIKELFRRIPMEKVVFIIDHTTDRQFMEKTFEEARDEITKGGANDHETLQVNVYRLEGENYDISKLFETLIHRSPHHQTVKQ